MYYGTRICKIDSGSSIVRKVKKRKGGKKVAVFLYSSINAFLGLVQIEKRGSAVLQ